MGCFECPCLHCQKKCYHIYSSKISKKRQILHFYNHNDFSRYIDNMFSFKWVEFLLEHDCHATCTVSEQPASRVCQVGQKESQNNEIHVATPFGLYAHAQNRRPSLLTRALLLTQNVSGRADDKNHNKLRQLRAKN